MRSQELETINVEEFAEDTTELELRNETEIILRTTLLLLLSFKIGLWHVCLWMGLRK